MLGIFLKILSIIGISILVILLLILFIVLMVLFSPITYRLKGAKETGENFWGKAKFTYLFGMIRLYFSYPEPGNLVVKLLCFKIYDSSKPKKQKKSKKKKEKDIKEDQEEKEDLKNDDTSKEKSDGGTDIIEFERISTKDTKVEEQTQTDVLEDTKKTQSKESETLEKSDESADMDEEKDMDVSENDKTSILDKIKGFFEKIRGFEHKLKNFIHNTKIKQKVTKVYNEITFYKDLATGQEGSAFLKHLKKRVLKILKKVKPRKYKVKIVFGADSPDITGYAVAGYGMILPRIKKPNYFDLQTDFTQAVFEGTFDIKGHFILFTIVFNGLMLLLDQNFKKLRRRLKKHKHTESKAA